MAAMGQLFSPRARSFLLLFWQLQADTGQEQHVGTHLGGQQSSLHPLTHSLKVYSGTMEIQTGQEGVARPQEKSP